MPAISIKPATLAELQRQFNFELSASHSYLAVAIWCDAENFKGFARFFYKQAGEERLHAQKFTDHLLNRGVSPELAAIPAPKGAFKNLMEVAKQAQNMEAANTRGINAAYQAALQESDYPAQVLLQWFINEQIEEEAWTDEMADRIERASCAGSLGDLDRHIERYLEEKTSSQ
jgi:ferritin